MELKKVRKQFATLNNHLRNVGMNPLEAIKTVAALLAGSEPSQTTLRELPPQARESAQFLLHEERVDGSAIAIAFQEFLLSEARHGLGQYLTPAPVAEMIATIVGTRSGDGIAIDPFCGSGLLLEELGHKNPHLKLLGIEINPAVSEIAQAIGSLGRHPIEVKVDDAFASWCEGSLPEADCVAANPPFGALATNVSIRQLQDVGVPTSLLRMRAIPSELLGLELCVSILRDEGHLGIVLPQSVLTNHSWARYRADVFRRLDVFAVVSLPEETFSPFRGVAKACVIFATKKQLRLPRDVRFFRSQSVGYDASGRATEKNDLPSVTAMIEESNGASLARFESSGLFEIPPAVDGISPEDCFVLGEIAEVFRGRNPSRNAYTEQGPWLVKVGDLHNSFISWRERPRTRLPQSFYQKHAVCHLRVGDICLTGAAHKPSYIGQKVDLVDELPPEGAMPSAEVVVIRMKESSPIEPEQLLQYLRSESGYSQLQDVVRGSTGHLYPQDVEGLLIPNVGGLPWAREAKSLFWETANAFRRYREAEERMRRAIAAATAGKSPIRSEPAE